MSKVGTPACGVSELSLLGRNRPSRSLKPMLFSRLHSNNDSCMHHLSRSGRLLDLALRRPLPSCSIRSFSTTCPIESGHSRWSKIKHDKAKVDAGRTKVRSYISAGIRNASKVGGPSPQSNPRLAAMLVEARKNDMPKALVEKAIARGQGLSPSGAPLESFTIEFMLPPAVAGILELETDSRGRTLQDLKAILKEHGASITPCAYMFDRRGRVVFGAESRLTEENVLENAIEAGALDVGTEEEDGFVVWTEPEEMASVSDALSSALEAPVRSAELVYVAKDDTKAEDGGEEFEPLMGKLNDFPEIQEMYLNTS